MEEMQVAFKFVTARARRLVRAISYSESGALTLEWLVIAAILVAAVGIAGGIFEGVVKAAAHKLK
jgi:hypothetical protein